MGMSWSSLCVVLRGEGRVAHCPVLAVGGHHPLPQALLGAIGTVHGRPGPGFPHRVQSHVHHSCVVLGRRQRWGQWGQVGEALWELFGVVLGHHGEIQGVAPRAEIVQGGGVTAGKLLAVPSLVEPGPKGREKSNSDLPEWKTMENPQRSPGEKQGKLFPLPIASS